MLAAEVVVRGRTGKGGREREGGTRESWRDESNGMMGGTCEPGGGARCHDCFGEGCHCRCGSRCSVWWLRAKYLVEFKVV